VAFDNIDPDVLESEAAGCEMKKGQRILLAAAVGGLLIASARSLLGGVFGETYADTPGEIFVVFGVVLGASGLLLVSYAAREIHLGALPLLWGIVTLGLLARYMLLGGSEYFFVEYLTVLFLGIIGTWLVIKGVRRFMSA